MLDSIKGYYEYGRIVHDEISSVSTKTKVIVTFLTEEKQAMARNKRKLGGLEGLVTLPVDFNEPLDDLKEYM